MRPPSFSAITRRSCSRPTASRRGGAPASAAFRRTSIPTAGRKISHVRLPLGAKPPGEPMSGTGFPSSTCGAWRGRDATAPCYRTAPRSICPSRWGVSAWSSGRSRSTAACILPTLRSACVTHPRTRVARPSINWRTSAYTASRRGHHRWPEGKRFGPSDPRLVWPFDLCSEVGDGRVERL
jgi:hypothetical protein